jgi:hypothetical protein
VRNGGDAREETARRIGGGNRVRRGDEIKATREWQGGNEQGERVNDDSMLKEKGKKNALELVDPGGVVEPLSVALGLMIVVLRVLEGDG